MTTEKEEQIAVLALQSWKSSPALSKWFPSVWDFFEYTMKFDAETVNKLCQTHLAVKLISH